MAVGYNNFDLPAMTARKVLATNTPDVLTETTADFGFALLMATARRVTEGEHYLRAGKWQRWSYDMFSGSDVHGSTLGILGGGVGNARLITLQATAPQAVTTVTGERVVYQDSGVELVSAPALDLSRHLVAVDLDAHGLLAGGEARLGRQEPPVGGLGGEMGQPGREQVLVVGADGTDEVAPTIGQPAEPVSK